MIVNVRLINQPTGIFFIVFPGQFLVVFVHDLLPAQNPSEAGDWGGERGHRKGRGPGPSDK